ncbi:MAG: serine/threonine-protein kinase [Holophaga sp.]|jgi:serine/threonine-protein kinase
MPKQIGKYEILRTLGQGAMGEVYLANHPVIGREVAIKTILPTAAKGEDAEGRFRREAEAAGRLSHPNLVTIFDFDKDQDVFYLVMEYVKGDDLEDLIKNRGLSHSQFLEVLAQVCDGLSHAHRRGIIHRDIKPSNVRVIRDGKNLLAKVMDFGIARVQDSNMTATGIVMGTVSYMAPEYIREGHATAQSDLFAVGVMLYECLSGRKPFPGDNTTTILFKIVSETPPPIDPETIHGISPNVHLLLDKALAKDPADRYQNADALGKALRAAKDPTWSGALDEATAMLVRQRVAQGTQAVAPGSQALAPGTQMVPGATAAPALVQPAPPGATTMLPAPAPEAVPSAPTTMIQARPRRTGLYAAAAAVVVVAAGAGGFLALRPRAKAPETPLAAAAAALAPPAPSPAAPAQTPASAPAAPAAVPAAPAAAPVKAAPALVPVKAAPAPAPAPAQAKTEPPPAAPKPAEPPPDPMMTIGKLIDTDPHQAVAVLKPLVQEQPGNVERQANYLAALYRSKSPGDFDRAFTRATASGVTVKAMLNVPSFKAALVEESKLQRSKSPSAVLPPDVLAKVLEGL